MDAERLEAYARLAARVSREAGIRYRVSHTTDLREGLEGARFVVISFAVKRNELWKLDFEIPKKHGVKHVTGECGGPGAAFHTCRNVPIILDIARAVEDVCPEALVMVATNPEARLCLALERYTNIRPVGLCHGIEILLQHFAGMLGKSPGELEVTAAGVNHFTWMLDLRLKATGESVYGLLRERIKERPDYMPLSQKMDELFGLFPSPGDRHIGEYLPFAWEYCGLDGPHFPLDPSGKSEREAQEKLLRQANGDLPIGEYTSGRTWADTLAFPIINAIVTGRPVRMPALNVRNEGYISNLPDGAIVEVPARVDGNGIFPETVGPLPKAIAAMCRREIDIQELVVEAAVTGDRRLLTQALAIDPTVWSVKAAEKIVDEMLQLQKEFLPQFFRTVSPDARGIA